jgi:glycolate oxidase FAD binding subunit
MVIAMKPLVEALQGLVGQDHAFSPSEGHHVDVDGITPFAMVEPGSYEEVAAVVHFANDEGLAVIPLGNGDFRWIGNIPHRYDIALSVSRLNAIVEYEPADLTITCQAGATLDDLNGPLSENGQIIPFAGGASPSCIGRLLALPMRESNLAWGTARDFTIGLRVVTADGRIIRTGGNVVKNVAGYDLTKLFIGSMGTLGVIVEATFKLAPAPQAHETLRFEFVKVSDGYRFASALCGRGLSLSHAIMSRSMSITDRDASPRGSWRFGFHLAGSRAAVARSRIEIAELASSAGGSADITESPKREGPLPAWVRAGGHLTCEAAVLPNLVPSLMDAVDEEAPGAFVEGLPLAASIGLTWLGAGPDVERVRRVRDITTSLGGSLVVTGCDTQLKRQIDVFGDPPPSFDLMRRIKQQFDPNGILSPGRFVGRL